MPSFDFPVSYQFPQHAVMVFFYNNVLVKDQVAEFVRGYSKCFTSKMIQNKLVKNTGKLKKVSGEFNISVIT